MNRSFMGKQTALQGVVVILCVLVSTVVSASESVLRVGITNRPVFQYMEQDGSFAGLDIELSEKIFKLAGLDIEYVMLPWRRIVYLVEHGEIDVALSAADSLERQKFAFFSKEPYRLGHNILFTTSTGLTKLQNIERLSDLEGTDFNLGVMRGVAYSPEYVSLREKEWFKSHLVTVDTVDRLHDTLLLGRVDGYLGSEFEQADIIAKRGLNGKIVPAFYLMTDEDAQSQIMFSKKTVSPDVVKRVDEAIIRFHASGEYDAILKKYRFPNLTLSSQN